jgi:hypothetical protein
METIAEPRREITFQWHVVCKTGTFYIHVPRDYAKLNGLKEGDLVELTIWTTMRRPHGERKPDQ